MCEYCEKKKKVRSNNFCGSAKLMVFEDGVLDVQGDENRFSLFKKIYCPRFDINYCPMCGRKLRNVRDR